MRLVSERDWLDAQLLEAFVLWVHHQILRLKGHELGSQPRLEELLVRRGVPRVLLVSVGVLILDSNRVWLDFSQTEELLVDVFIGVDVRASQVVTLAHRFLRLDAVVDGESNIICKDRLNFSISSFYDEVHPVEELHLHAPLGSDRWVRVNHIEHVSRSQDGHVRERLLDFLLSNPLGSQSHAVRVWVGPSS